MRVGRSIKRGLLVVTIWIACLLAAEFGYRGYLFVFQQFPDDPAAFDLYGVGESTMAGEPYQANFSLPDLVSSALSGHASDRPIRVRLLAKQGESTYPQAMAFERAVAFRNRSLPGAVLVYAGHNERIPPDGEPSARLNWSEKLERSPLCRYSWAVQDLLLHLRAGGVIRTEYSMGRYYELLWRIVQDARNAGLTPILYTLPSNDEIEPNAPDDAHLSETIARTMSKPAEAAASLQEAIAGASADAKALLYYEKGETEASLYKIPEALEDFRRAVDLDPRIIFGRATTTQNNTVRRLAGERKVDLADAATIIQNVHSASATAFFSDGQHPNLEGYAWLANSAAQILKWKSPFRDGDDVKQRFHLSAEDLSRSHRLSGAWLLATAVHHPWPMDRMDLAETHYRQSLGGDDDFSGWGGMAIAEAARYGLLRDSNAIALLTRLNIWYSPTIHVPESDWSDFEATLTKFGASPETVEHLRSARSRTP